MVRTSKVVRRFGSWVVTTYGVECTSHYYPIKAARLWEHEGSNYSWERHLSEKNWVNLPDATAALEFARSHHVAQRPKTKTW